MQLGVVPKNLRTRTAERVRISHSPQLKNGLKPSGFPNRDKFWRPWVGTVSPVPGRIVPNLVEKSARGTGGVRSGHGDDDRIPLAPLRGILVSN